MDLTDPPPAVDQPSPQEITLSGTWTAQRLGGLEQRLAALALPAEGALTVDAAQVAAMDSAGIWLLQRRFAELRRRGLELRLRAWPPQLCQLLELVGPQVGQAPPQAPPQPFLDRLGKQAAGGWRQAGALLAFVGESALALAATVRGRRPWRWRIILNNVENAGFDALPIVGLTSFLLGIVVAYQGADQLRRYGAGIFVVDLVGYSMLREFAPLITAIIVAGRSGSAYAAQIGTMQVAEEVDALRTLGIAPIDLLVLPKILAQLVALPLLTVFAAITGVAGGMIMAHARLNVGVHEFLDRFGVAVELSALFIGAGKALVFALIIAVIGCFQGFRTGGSADSVGRQTTKSVVQAIFLVIVADALFSIVFSVLGI